MTPYTTARELERIAEFRRTTPTANELAAILGANWAICRKTPRNLARGKNCITPKQYQAACAQALANRHG